jgi:hypothetical protein
MLDFSAGTDQSRAESEHTLICDAVSSGSMPPGFVHDDSSEGTAFKVGCQIDLRLGCRHGCTWQVNKSLYQKRLENT